MERRPTNTNVTVDEFSQFWRLPRPGDLPAEVWLQAWRMPLR